MTVVFGTLGFTPEKLVPTLARRAGVRKLVFYHDHDGRSKAAAERVRAYCRSQRLEVSGVELDAFDIIECAHRMRRDIRREGADHVVFNITGGTPVISSAATLACILEGARAVYIDERTKEEVPLPLLSMRYEEFLNPEQRRVLRFVARKGSCIQADVVKGLRLARATVSHHVSNLKAKQLIDAAPAEGDSRKEILTVRRSAALLLLEDEE